MNKTQFCMKRCRDKLKSEKKQIQLNKSNVKKEWIKKQKKSKIKKLNKI